ncbi:MAG: OmpA family protein [Candidatus Cloacimonetes bacterium]|nr:OmpA family protein [Candidatus Cloacimonadota bacterium]
MHKYSRFSFFLIVIGMLMGIVNTELQAQIFQRHIYTGLRGSAIKLIGGEEDDSTLRFSGHTDNTGSRSLNMKLSRRRAESVRRYLINQGIEAHRLRAIGLGPDHPVTSNKTKEGRAKNRRIEFFRTK